MRQTSPRLHGSSRETILKEHCASILAPDKICFIMNYLTVCKIKFFRFFQMQQVKLVFLGEDHGTFMDRKNVTAVKYFFAGEYSFAEDDIP